MELHAAAASARARFCTCGGQSIWMSSLRMATLRRSLLPVLSESTVRLRSRESPNCGQDHESTTLGC